MDFGLYVMLSLVVPILVLLGIIIVKMIKGKQLPSSHYTPFDYITGQAPSEFHEEKEDKEDQDDEGEQYKKHKKFRYRIR
ncbi:DUF3951 domain-containing protein [Paenibacillus albiflavus]|uniref:DUF3951 domain-containing protein n=1 Tax=Paenibacillus albiflavus TaxID=2545760 RepID=A0A4R4ELL5_9BACL|nr:DUF3951 domain-containing protein [Paenibacillus albiflavus]TCZ80909.1 DUF3951 domain-containing protein [Paenibacillus albiflavus]